jgi:hypothetical protein
MIDIILATIAFVASLVVFNKKSIGTSLSIWKAIGLAILTILGAVILYGLTGARFVSIVFVPTIICSVYVSTLYREILAKIHERQKELYSKREVQS